MKVLKPQRKGNRSDWNSTENLILCFTTLKPKRVTQSKTYMDIPVFLS